LESHHLVWSATSCELPGAALFFGLARQADVASLCGWRTKRQMAIFSGAPVSALGGRSLPTYYLAIRDPSCIRVKVVDGAPCTDGVRYVSLIFERERQVAASEAAAMLEHDGGSDAAFVITISLPIAKEEQFSREALPQGDEEWTEMFERLCGLGRRRG
jgi:hypothetical protein